MHATFGQFNLACRAGGSNMKEILSVPIHVVQESFSFWFEFASGNIYLCWTRAEDESGEKAGEIEFYRGVMYRFTNDPHCTGVMIKAYEKVIEIMDSPWVAEFAPQARDRFGEPVLGLRHFMFYADGNGCFEALAKDVRLHLYSE